MWRREMSWVFVFVAMLVLAMGAPPVFAQNVLQAKKVDTGPKLDGVVDSAWGQAKPLKVRVMGGVNLPGGGTEVTLQSLYTTDTIYFLVQYKDPTMSVRRGPFQKQADGSWIKLKDPNDKGGDNNLYYEDKFGMIWAIKSPTFEQAGCFAGCHAGEAGKPYGNKYLPAGELADMWHLKGVRTGPVGQIDDQYLDDTKYDKEKSPNAGRKNDKKDAGGYVDNTLVAGKPQWALPGNKAAGTYWILDTEKVPFDDSKYKAGDEVPGIIIAPFTGDRGDISLAQKWESGVWTYEFSRNLRTGSPTDVQFEDLKRKYAFGVAVFENAQVRHAFSAGVLHLVFE